MENLQRARWVTITPPGAIVDNAAFTTTEIDTVSTGIKYDWLTIALQLGALDIAPSVCKVTHSDTSGSGFTDVSGGSLSPVATDDNTRFVFHVDLRNKKRYIDFNLTGGDGAAGTYATAIGILTSGNEAPTTATMRGVTAEVVI